MKRAAAFSGILLVLVLSVLTAAISAAQESAGGVPEKDFCWRDSYGRGVGTVPTSCAPGQDMVGLLCYDKCSAGMQRAGVDCHSTCPAGFRDDGLFCRRAEYGRGAGYPWRFSDGFSSDGMLNRCNKDNQGLGCEMSGAIAYPKCRPGYTAVGCCICRPSVPDCLALGLGGNLDLSCAKKIEVGQPKLGACPAGTNGLAGAQEMDGGCYGSCQAGYKGVGPVCWGNAPKKPLVDPDWKECAMGAAKDDLTCGKVTFNQVASVGQLALTAATLGSSMLGSTAASSAQKAGMLADLEAKYNALIAAYNAAKQQSKAIQAAETAYEVGSSLNKAKNDISALKNAAKTAQNETLLAADITRAAAQIAAIVDTTGVSSVVSAYSYPLCSSYFPSRPPSGSATQ